MLAYAHGSSLCCSQCFRGLEAIGLVCLHFRTGTDPLPSCDLLQTACTHLLEDFLLSLFPSLLLCIPPC